VTCGVVGLSRLAAEGDLKWLETLRRMASDPHWHTREAVAMALQHLCKSNMAVLLQEMAVWDRGNFLEQRAAAAALCEPVLSHEEKEVELLLKILDDITAALAQLAEQKDRKSEEFRVLKKGLAYCWSVAVAVTG
jgi:predicted transcriptional regulator